jgi:protein arginine kinase activator
MQRGDRHIGKVPERFRTSEVLRAELSRLQNSLQTAVAQEDFESAASLRDQISTLKAQLPT